MGHLGNQQDVVLTYTQPTVRPLAYPHCPAVDGGPHDLVVLPQAGVEVAGHRDPLSGDLEAGFLEDHDRRLTAELHVRALEAANHVQGAWRQELPVRAALVARLHPPCPTAVP